MRILRHHSTFYVCGDMLSYVYALDELHRRLYQLPKVRRWYTWTSMDPLLRSIPTVLECKLMTGRDPLGQSFRQNTTLSCAPNHLQSYVAFL